jgi:hypothetical protein
LCGGAVDDRRRLGCHSRQPLGLVGFQRFDRQLELFALLRQLLRGPAKLGPAERASWNFSLAISACAVAASCAIAAMICFSAAMSSGRSSGVGTSAIISQRSAPTVAQL